MAEQESNIQKLPITKEIRKSLVTRNLYSEINEYDINNPAVVKAIDYVVDAFKPGNSFSFRDSLAGRVLLPDTKLAQIGSVQLAKQFSYRAYNTTQVNNVPNVNINALFDKDPNTRLFSERLDYKITPLPSNGNTIFDQIKNEITGTPPKSPFDKNSKPTDYFNTLGNGQTNALQRNLTNSVFNVWFPASPLPELSISRLMDDRSFAGIGGVSYDYLDKIEDQSQLNSTISDNVKNTEGIDSVVYYDKTSSDSYLIDKGFGLTTNLSQQNVQPIRQDFPDPDEINEFSYVGIPDSDMKSKFGADRGLLYFTNKIIRESEVGTKNNQLSLGRFTTNGKETLRGSLPCRVFTKVKTTNADDLAFYGDGYTNSDHQYRSYGRLIRREGIRLYNPDATSSVIYDFVVPKFHPKPLNDNKKYMLSIENLAYNMKGSVSVTENGIKTVDFADEDGTVIPNCEVGSGGGRLMYFIPYNLKFSESITVDYNPDQFLGRPEKVYTYNSTDRKLSLSFMLLIDYPDIANTLDVSQLANFFAGCDITAPNTPITNSPYTGNTKTPPPLNIPDVNGIGADYYFPNAGDLIGNKDPIDPHYEDGSRMGAGYQITNRTLTAERYQERDYGLNKNFKTDLSKVVRFLLENDNLKYYKVVFRATASKLYKEKTNNKLPPYEKQTQETQYNLDLSKGRLFSGIETFFSELENQGGNRNSIETLELIKLTDGSIGGSQAGATLKNVSDREVKLERSIHISLEKNSITDDKIKQENDIIVNTAGLLKTKNAGTYDCYKFDDNKFVPTDHFPIGFDKVKTFQPVFHSQTPEDFHRRLTFLQQCTRPGRALDNKVSASNSIFGRQPICILRIGDFIHSKVVMHSLNIDYTDSPWDQNPEGMGMQPMIANVSMDLTLIGGQSLDIPIDQIQNALDFNFYANSTIYNTGVYEKANKRQTEQNAFQKYNLNKK